MHASHAVQRSASMIGRLMTPLRRKRIASLSQVSAQLSHITRLSARQCSATSTHGRSGPRDGSSPDSPSNARRETVLLTIALIEVPV